MNDDSESAVAAYEKGIGVFADALPVLPNEETRCMAFYMMGLDYWYLEQWQPAADSFLASIEADPQFRFAGAMHWLISECYEKLKAAGQVRSEDADPVIEWGYQTVFDQYPDDPIVEHAALRLGEINLARGLPVTACVYFNWFLDRAGVQDGRAGEVRRILEGKGIGGCR